MHKKVHLVKKIKKKKKKKEKEKKLSWHYNFFNTSKRNGEKNVETFSI